MIAIFSQNRVILVVLVLSDKIGKSQPSEPDFGKYVNKVGKIMVVPALTVFSLYLYLIKGSVIKTLPTMGKIMFAT